MQDVSVLAILVATDGEAWLPEVIRGLLQQSHPHLDVIGVDNASSDRSGELLSSAFGGNSVVLERRVGYGRALAAGLKVALDRGSDADAFLILHDDTALDPDAVAAMTDAMSGDESIGIVGGKIVEWDDELVLQEVGMATDRQGRIFSGLDRGEIDQGQHDGTRDVLFCTSAAMLVRRDVVSKIGLFDLRYVAMRDDLDLCWRARAAGWRVVVTTDARARHVAAASRGIRVGPVSGATRYFGERNLIATLIKNYSLRRLLGILPVVVVQSVLSAFIAFLRGRRGQARQIIGALEWNIVHAPSSIKARARARHHNKAAESEVTRFMVRGTPRMRGYVERALESIVGEPVEGIEETEIGTPPDAVRERRSLVRFVRDHPVAASVFALLGVYLIGSRDLFGAGGLAGESLLPFPSTAEFFREFTSGWRSAPASGAHPPGLAYVLLGALSVVSFGSAWLASRILVLALLPIAGFAAGRAAGRLGMGRAGKLTTGAVYALSPLALASFSNGRLPELVLLAVAPAIVVSLMRRTGSGSDESPAEPGADSVVAAEPGWRNLAASAVLLAVAGSLSPWALVFAMGAGVTVALAAIISGAPRPLHALRDAGIVVAGAWLLLFPWSTEFLRTGTPLGVGGPAPASPMWDLLRLAPGGSPLGVMAWAFPASVLLAVGLAARRRPQLVVGLASVVVVALLAAWSAGRWATVAPRQALPLIGCALGVALLAGLGVSSISPVLRERSFGFAHVGTVLAVAFLTAAGVTGLGYLARGDRDGLIRTGGVAPAFLIADVATAGEFRVLWIGGRDGVTEVDLTGPAGDTMLAYGVRRAGEGEDYLLRATAALLGGGTDLGGRLLAPIGVRQVIVRPSAPEAAAAALRRQSDLRFRVTFGGARVYDNTAWLPVAAPLADPEQIRVAARADAFSALATIPAPDPVRGLVRDGAASYRGRPADDATTLLLAEPFHPAWRLRWRGGTVEPKRAFGYAMSFAIPSNAGEVRLDYTGRGTRPLLLIQLGLWVMLGIWWSRKAAIERGER